MTDKDTVLSLEQTLRLALEALENSDDLVRENAYRAEQLYGNYPARQGKVRGLKVLADDHEKAITAIKDALSGEAQTRSVDKDVPVGLIESLKDAKPCCGQYETCWRACTPRGKFIGQRDAQRKPLTDEEMQRIIYEHTKLNPNQRDDKELIGYIINAARAIEAAHGIIDPTDLKGKHDA